MSHYFTNDEVKEEKKLIDIYVKEKTYKFYTNAGVFSKEKIDFGTKTLLESIDNLDGKVLDVGCGYGPIGIILASLFNCHVDMVDVNERAIELSKKNAELNNIKNVNVYLSDAYSNVSGLYDYIITNPPIRAGKSKVYEILFGAYDHLKDSGKLILVIRKEQGAKSTIKDLEDKYNVNILKKNKGFYVILCIKG